MSQYDLDILGLPEVRWPGAGHEKPPSGHNIIFSGPESRGEHRVALMMMRKTSLSLLKWQPVSSRILTARFPSQHAKLSVVVCYAHTNEANDSVKEEFQGTLQPITTDIARYDMACFVGDDNAKIGDDRQYYPKSVGCMASVIGTKMVSF